jgi:hypothetical protein
MVLYLVRVTHQVESRESAPTAIGAIMFEAVPAKGCNPRPSNTNVPKKGRLYYSIAVYRLVIF